MKGTIFMAKYVLGVDGGASKTHYALYDTTGSKLAFIEGGPSNHEHFPDTYEATKRELYTHIQSLLSTCRLCMDDISFGVFGLAGADVKIQYRELTKRISSIGLKNFKVYNDAFIGIKR